MRVKSFLKGLGQAELANVEEKIVRKSFMNKKLQVRGWKSAVIFHLIENIKIIFSFSDDLFPWKNFPESKSFVFLRKSRNFSSIFCLFVLLLWTWLDPFLCTLRELHHRSKNIFFKFIFVHCFCFFAENKNYTNENIAFYTQRHKHSKQKIMWKRQQQQKVKNLRIDSEKYSIKKNFFNSLFSKKKNVLDMP